jgi:hypothetical protein
MRERCPGSIALRRHILQDWRLEFVGEDSRWGRGGVATILPQAGNSVEGALYLLTEDHERALDGFEGVNHSQPERGQYCSDRSVVQTVDGPALVYIATELRGTANLPNASYRDVILEGYNDWGIDPANLSALRTYPRE